MSDSIEGAIQMLRAGGWDWFVHTKSEYNRLFFECYLCRGSEVSPFFHGYTIAEVIKAAEYWAWNHDCEQEYRKVFTPPKEGDWGIFKCLDHWHVGFLWVGIDWDDDIGYGNELYWEELTVGTTFEKASNYLMGRMRNG